MVDRALKTLTPPSTTATVRTGPAFEQVFSGAGAVVTTTTSPPYRIRQTMALTSIVVELGTAGTSTTTVAVKVNGTTVAGGAVSLTSGQTYRTVTPSAPTTLTADVDVLTVAVTAAGAGAKDLTVQARFG